jgi:hypothetical protein
MRPRGYGRGWKSAAARQARYQRYYTRASNAGWTAERRADDAIYESVAIGLLKGIGAIVLCGAFLLPVIAWASYKSQYGPPFREPVTTKRYAHQR